MNRFIIIAAVVAAATISSCKTPKEVSATSGTAESPVISISGDQNPEQFRQRCIGHCRPATAHGPM